MKALRDFNLSKIVSHDRIIILGLIHDFFQGIEAEYKTNPTLKEACK